MTEAEKKKMRAKAAKLSNPTPIELPSGIWRCQITVNGKRHSVTDQDPVVAHEKAVAMRGGYLGITHKSQLTVRQAIDRYIDSKTSILSPSTLYEYRRAAKNDFKDVEDYLISDMSVEFTQRWVNNLAASHSPKTVRNTFALFQSAVKPFTDARYDNVVLPKKEKTEIVVPTTEEVDALSEIFRTLHRIDVCFREDIFRAQAFEQNRIQSLFGKREEPLPVFSKGGGKSNCWWHLRRHYA